jgi:protein-S-isoprenylcysteine O-methyltransferase Ste14
MLVMANRLCLTVLLLACLASFAWGMRYFFVHPEKWSVGMRVSQVCGTIFALLHLAAILFYNIYSASVAAGLYVCSLALFWWALRSNRRRPLTAAFLADLPRHLMDRGPYRFIRHPFYTSYLLTWSAGIIATGRWWLIPTLLAMLVIYWKASQAEEQKFAHSELAAAYAAYRAKTGRFLPNPWKLAGLGKSGWLWFQKDAPRLD